MCWFLSWGVLCILAVCSYIYIRIHKIPVGLLIFWGIFVLVCHIVLKEIDIWLIAGGAAAGLLFLAVSKATKEALGYGDSLGILILGIQVGLWELLELLLVTFFLLAAFAGMALWRKKMTGQCVLPFFPFLLAGYAVMFLEKGGRL